MESSATIAGSVISKQPARSSNAVAAPGASAAKRCRSALWRKVLSLVRKSRNSSGGLYRCRRRSAHDRRRTNAMRFLMKNHPGTPNTALDSCVPAKTFWMRSGPAAVFAPSAKPRLGHLGNCPSANRAHRPFRKSSILLLKAVAAAIIGSVVRNRQMVAACHRE